MQSSRSRNSDGSPKEPSPIQNDEMNALQPIRVDCLQSTSINVASVDETEGDDDDFQEVVFHKAEVDRDEVSRKDLELQLIEIRKELLLLKKEKLKEEQRRLVSEAGVPKVHDFIFCGDSILSCEKWCRFIPSLLQHNPQ